MSETIKILKTIPEEQLNEWKKLIIESLHFTCETLKKYNIPHWIDFGTLLGACRHKGLIYNPEIGNFDDDSDVSILMEDREIVIKIFEKETKNSEWIFTYKDKNNFQIYKDKFKERILKCQTDIMIWQKAKKDQIHYAENLPPPVVATPIPKELIFPLSTIMFEGKIVNCPKNPEEFVESKYRYGENAIKTPKYRNTNNKKRLPYTILAAYRENVWKKNK